MCLSRAFRDEGEALAVLVRKRRNKAAALEIPGTLLLSPRVRQ
jgi:transposase-like protein